MFRYFFHFELLTSNTITNETREKFKNILGMNLLKYSFKFLADTKYIYSYWPTNKCSN